MRETRLVHCVTGVLEKAIHLLFTFHLYLDCFNHCVLKILSSSFLKKGLRPLYKTFDLSFKGSERLILHELHSIYVGLAWL